MTTSKAGWRAQGRDKIFQPISGEFLDNEPPEPTQLLSLAAAAEQLGVSLSTARRLQQERRIPFFKIGRCVRIARSDLTAYLAMRRVDPVG